MNKKSDSVGIIASRIALASIFFISGLSGFIDFETYGLFTVQGSEVSAITQTPHYYALKGIEILLAFFFVANYFVPTALLVAAPILVGAIGYHFWTEPIIGALLLLALIPVVALFIFYRDIYALFFRPQLYTNHMSEKTATVLTYEEVREKKPGLEKDFERIYNIVRSS